MRKENFEWIVTDSGETVPLTKGSEEALVRACEKELKYLLAREESMRQRAMRTPSEARTAISNKIPEKAQFALREAFFRAFQLVFQKGSSVIGATFDRGEAVKDHLINDYAVRLKGSHKELKRVRRAAGKADKLNSVISTVEGAGLGFLGVGLPDVVLFISVILKGIYEKAAFYGHDHMAPRERYFILKMIEAALSRGENWLRADSEVDALMFGGREPTDEELDTQMRRTSDACAMDMLIIKTVQGIPLVGTVGGITNPIYYGKIMKYVKTKYQKRYVMSLFDGRRFTH